MFLFVKVVDLIYHKMLPSQLYNNHFIGLLWDTNELMQDVTLTIVVDKTVQCCS